MKTHFYFSVFLSLFLSIGYSQPHKATAIKNIGSENQVNLDIHPVQPTLAVTHIQQAVQNFSLNATPLDLGVESISYNALASLQLTATTLSTQCTHTDVVTAFKIIYGSVNDKLVTFYKPLLCCRTGTQCESPDYVLEGEYSVVEYSDYFKYHNFKFEKITGAAEVAATQAAISNYSMTLKIKTAAGTRTFNPTQNITGDVNSVYFSFQELFKIMDDNNTNSIFLWNSLKEIQISTAILLKHSILLSADNILELPFKSQARAFVFEKAYANLAHLCPPSCGSSIFRLRY